MPSKASEPRTCFSCGRPENKHRVRHLFVASPALPKIPSPSRRKKITPPRHRSSWWEILPGVWKLNPQVVCVMVPLTAKAYILDMPDGSHLGVLRMGKAVRGLQVIDPEIDEYIEQVAHFREHRIEMADPSYIGPLGDIFPDLLMEEERFPILFLRDAMWRDYLNLRRIFKRAPEPC